MDLIMKLFTCLGCWLVFSSFNITIVQGQTIRDEMPFTSAELFDRGFALVNEDVGKADSLITVAWRIAYAKKDALGIANGYFYKGCVYDRKMMLDSAIYFLEKSIELYLPQEALTNVPDAYGRVGLLKFKKNDIQEGLEFLIKGIKVAELNNNQRAIVRLSIVLAMHHNDYTAHYHEALSYLDKAEISAKKLKDESLLGHIYLQYSVSYQQLNALEKAEKYARRSIESFRKINSTYNEMRALFVLGGVYVKERDSDKLLGLLAEVQPKLRTVPDGLLQANYDKLYAETFFMKGDFKEALLHAERSSHLLGTGGQTQGVIELNKLKYRIYYALGDILKADSLYLRAEASLDSTFSARAYSIDAELRQKYDSDKKQHQIELQTLQLRNASNFRYGLIALLVLLGALVIALYKRFLVNKRLNELHELLLNEVNHRVKNNLQLLSSILNMQNRKLETKEAKELIRKSIARLKTFSIIHDSLYRQNSINSIDMRSFLSQLCEGNETASGEDIHVLIDAHEVQLNVDFAMHIGLIINELVTNTCKYAFTETKVTQSLSTYEDVMIALDSPYQLNEIKISLAHLSPSAIEITYQDSGPGIQNITDLENQKSMGMKLIFGLVKQMQGTVHYDPEKNQFLILLKYKHS